MKKNRPLKVAFPLGIGDSHWSCMKLKALKELHDGVEIHACINKSVNHKTWGYLDLFESIDVAKFDPGAVYDITNEMEGSYKHPRWGTLDGCKDWKGYDYVFVANHWMEQGIHISQWIPELATEYSFKYQFKDHHYQRSYEFMEEPTVLLYLSGINPNKGFHDNWWEISDWVTVVRLLNQKGITPILVGAKSLDDLGYVERFEKQAQPAQFKNLVGETTIPDYIMLIERCRVWVGLCSGGGIVASSAGTPTVMFWPSAEYPHAGSAGNHWKPEFRTAWHDPSIEYPYLTASYGDPNMTPQSVVDQLMEVIR